jgi:putative membrane protein
VTAPGTRSAEELAAERTSLAATRTLMAADRTLMAWVRTSLSLLSFAFTIYNIFEQLPVLANRTRANVSGRDAGLILAALGTFAVVAGTIEYWHTLKMLRQSQHFTLTRPALAIAFMMSFLGVGLLVSIGARLM